MRDITALIMSSDHSYLNTSVHLTGAEGSSITIFQTTILRLRAGDREELDDGGGDDDEFEVDLSVSWNATDHRAT